MKLQTMKWKDNRGVYFMDGTVVVGVIVGKSQIGAKTEGKRRGLACPFPILKPFFQSFYLWKPCFFFSFLFNAKRCLKDGSRRWWRWLITTDKNFFYHSKVSQISLLWAELCLPPPPPQLSNSRVEVLTHMTQNGTAFGDEVFKEVIVIRCSH